MTDDKPSQFNSSPGQWAKLKPLARDMRREPTAAESVLWQRIRNRQLDGAKFRRQHTVQGFIVDFICVEQKLIIEVDGAVHEQSERQQYDVQRQEFLESRGFRVLRFTNAEVLQSLETVAHTIVENLTRRG